MRATILLKGKLAPSSVRSRRHRPQFHTPWTLLAVLCAAAPAQGESGMWRDIESRIQYGYYTEDAAALRHLTQAVTNGPAQDKLRGYYAALLDWRLALLARQNVAATQGSTAQLAQRCVNEADTSLALQADFAEALALRAACRATPLESGGAHTPFAAYRARRDLERALQLAAHNPRVLLVDAMSEEQLGADKGASERALPKLRRAVAAFDAERGNAEQLPGWGAAEAWLLLADELFSHRDPLGARDALEHALLIAPQYAQARRLLTKITAP
jgi:hypothetical protein